VKGRDQETLEWKNFDDSPLPKLLRYDYWSPNVAIPLICNIDTARSEEFDQHGSEDQVDYVDILPGTEVEWPTYKSIRLLSEDRNCFLDDERRNETTKKVKDLWEIYFSNPDHGIINVHVWSEDELLAQLDRPPKYFIEWAKSKSVQIPWLMWARDRGFVVDKPMRESSSANDPLTSNTLPADDRSGRATPSELRRDEGLVAAKMILKIKSRDGKLSREKFNDCMKKSAVISFIRQRPELFPRCADVESYQSDLYRQTTKDKEPTLSKDFPDFTKHMEILEEYRKLTGDK
jgi:hypothetical protein